VGRDLRERDENECTFGKTGMRDFEVGLGDDLIAEEQDVEVERARAVWKTGCAVAAELALDSEQAFEQGARGEFGFERDHGVDKVRLVGEADGRGGVERRAGNEAAQGFEARCGGGERGFGRASVAWQVGAEADIGGGHAAQIRRVSPRRHFDARG